jgi:sortase A
LPAVHGSERRRWDLARVLGTLGGWLIAAGLIVLLFVAYQLWGTGIRAAQSQARLENRFEERVAAAQAATASTTTTGASATSSTTTSGTAETTPPAPSTTAAPLVLPPTAEGEDLFRIEMPSIGEDHIVVAGTKVEDLRKGPGHYPSTPLPGEIGNVGIAGHRTTWGQPFYDIDRLQTGDEIVLTNLLGMRFVYRVTEQLIVSPSDTWVVNPTPTATLTLTSCHPRFSAAQRIVVKAELDTTIQPALGSVTIGFYDTTPETQLPDSQDPSTVTTAAVDSTVPSGTDSTTADAATTTAAPPVGTSPSPAEPDLLTAGWFSDSGAFAPSAAWAAICAAIAFVAWRLGKAWRRWPAYLVALPIFAVALFLCFEQVNRLLPQNI